MKAKRSHSDTAASPEKAKGGKKSPNPSLKLTFRLNVVHVDVVLLFFIQSVTAYCTERERVRLLLLSGAFERSHVTQNI